VSHPQDQPPTPRTKGAQPRLWPTRSTTYDLGKREVHFRSHL